MKALIALVAIPGSLVLASAASAKVTSEPGVSFKMISDAPPALERATLPYRNCVTQWMQSQKGRFEDITHNFDFRNGPPECAEVRRRSAASGFAALSAYRLSDERRQRLIRQNLLTIDLSIFSGLIWTSESLPVNQSATQAVP